MTVDLSQQPHDAPLTEVIDRWAGRRVLVVGDVLLDEWCFGESDRLCREAPAPVLRTRRRTWAAGGAGNTAVNLAALGARPILVGPVGDDPAGVRLRDRLAAQPGLTDRLLVTPGRPTPCKRRLLVADQVLLREDDGVATEPLTGEATRALVGRIEAAVRDDPTPVLVVGDHGLGGLPDDLRGWLSAHRDRFAVVALDAHDLRPWQRMAPTLLTPSLAEAARVVGGAGEESPDRPAAAVRSARQLRESTGAAVVAVTLDRDGAVMTGPDGGQIHTTTDPAPASHTVGAGDVYLAAATLALVVGAAPPTVAALAQRAARLSVTGVGTCGCDRDSLRAAVRSPDRPADPKVVDEAGLHAAVGRCRERGGRVVFTNGCFDVLHRGHVTHLRQARQLGDLLVVALNGDDSVRRLKGAERPVNPVEDRATVLAELSSVDAVVVFDEDSPARLIEAVRPDLYVKGGDYPPELVPEAPLVRRLGGDVRTLSYVPDRSTSAVITRIRSRTGSGRRDGRSPARSGGGT